MFHGVVDRHAQQVFHCIDFSQIIIINLLEINLVDELNDRNRFYIFLLDGQTLLNAMISHDHSCFVTIDRHNH